MVALAQARLLDGAALVGDALALPFADSAFDRLLTAHFYGQRPPAEREAFLAEATRVAGSLSGSTPRCATASSPRGWQERTLKRRLDPPGLQAHKEVDPLLRSGRRGAAVLRRILEERHPDAHLARSELESRALEKVGEAGLPWPEVNAWLPALGLEVDLLWRERRIAVELDGGATTGTATPWTPSAIEPSPTPASPSSATAGETRSAVRSSREWRVDRAYRS